MKPVSRGFTTLTAAVCLIFLLTLLGDLLYQTREQLFRQSTVADRLETARNLRKHLDQLLGQGNLDPAPVPGLPDGFTVTVEDQSGRIDLNTVSPVLLGTTTLRKFFVGPLDGFLEFRRTKGPFPSESAYAAWLDPGALAQVFRCGSFININAADPEMLGKIAAARTGDLAWAGALENRVRLLQADGQPVAPDQLDYVLDKYRTDLTPLVGTEGWLNVNQVSGALLGALVTNPAWAFPGAPEKVTRILALRNERPLAPEDLVNLLGTGPNHPIFQYLGTRSRFFEVTYRRGNSLWSAAVADTSATDRPRWRILSREGAW